ncbi:MAG: TatD family hydrolase [Blastocatellia bacterium]|nr:TatD family hydrolase [Blastocatellia bacterium]
MFIDSHAHLDDAKYDGDRAEVISRARAAGIDTILEICGTEIARGSLDQGIALAEEYPFIYAAIGVHPHEANLYDDAIERKLVELSLHDKVVGWGEIGLDYYYDNSPRDVQRGVFGRQLGLARSGGLPAIIHTRDAEDDTIAILRESKIDTGVIHCFTGTKRLADAAIGMGFYLSFSGVLTFKTANEIREVARSMPLEKILIETDCPYLSPVPHRGKRNEPSFVLETAAKLAELRGCDVAEIAQITSDNFKRLFNLQ